MKKSLVEILEALQRREFERWFDEFLPDEELLTYLNQDSWELHEAIMYLWAKKLFPGFDSQFHDPMFMLQCKELALRRAANASSEKEAETFLIINEGIVRLSKVYDAALRCIRAPKLRGKESTLRGNWDTINGTPRYYVRPKEFLKWVYKRHLLTLPRLTRFIEAHVLEKKRGRAQSELRKDILQKGVRVSQRPECRDKMYARAILMHDDETRECVENLFKLKSRKPQTHKLSHFARELGKQPGFSGKTKSSKS